MAKKVYFAAALFNGREKLFNAELAERLEKRGHKVFLPQRDGFEFSRLGEALKKHLLEDEIGSAVQDIIYFYDMGIQLRQSDAIVANLDELTDEGVVTEVCYAHLMRKYVIGFRTDVRSPYGDASDSFGGMHFFPAYQCDVFLKIPFSTRDLKQTRKRLDILEVFIDGELEEIRRQSYPDLPDVLSPNFSQAFEGARILFMDVDDINSERGLERIALNYRENRPALKKLRPRVVEG